MLGTNDSKFINWTGPEVGDQYAQDYADMIATLEQLPSDPKIFVMVPPPLWAPAPYNMQIDVTNTIYPVLVRVIGTDNSVELIDNFTPLSQKNMTLDNCHPNDEGHRTIAANVVAAIT